MGVLGALGRRWWAVVLAVAVGAVLSVQVWRAPEVYWATTKLLLVSPTKLGQQLTPGSNSLIAVAGILETEVNDGRSLPRSASADVSLVDQGINDYAQVRVPNTGGQWANNYTEPALIVEVSGSSAAVVQDRLDTLISRVETELALMQVDVAPSVTITVIPFPPPSIQHSGGRRTVAVGLIGGLALAGGFSLAVLLDVAWSRFRRRQTGSASGSGVDTRARASA
jgi:hypothetical protein